MADLTASPLITVGLLVVWVVLFGVLILHCSRSRAITAEVTLIGNGLSLLSLVVAVAEVAVFSAANPAKPHDDLVELIAGPMPRTASNSHGPRRDIYYIVLDRYGNADQLREVYDFDNDRFIADMTAEGFSFPGPAFANYQRTAHSLASTLNLNYLDPLAALVGENSGNWRPLYALLEETQVHRFLDRQGYRLLHFGSWWNPTRINRLAEENHNWWAIPEFLRLYVGSSLVGYFAKANGAYAFDTRRQQCDRIQHKFEMLKQTTNKPGPKFVFAHILLPHPPFVFGRDGTCLSRDFVAGRARRDNYIDQVEFANRLVLDFVRSIRNSADIDPIIVLQADEGPWPERFVNNEIDGLGRDVTTVDWAEVSDAELREKMGILHALYLPGVAPPRVPRGMTPINTFRIIFNRYFGADLPLLADRSFIFRDNDRLYSFLDVTARLRDPAAMLSSDGDGREPVDPTGPSSSLTELPPAATIGQGAR